MNKKIAVIDDEPEIRDVLKDLLKENYSFLVVEFAGVDEFLDTLETELYDLIISDVHMPSGSGLRLTSELESLNKKIPLIFISGFVDLLPPKEGIFVLRKPLNHKELFNHIQSILNL